MKVDTQSRRRGRGFNPAVAALMLAVSVPSLAGQPPIDSLTVHADSLLKRADADAARRLYEEAVKLDEHHRGARLGLGESLLALRRWDDAEDAFLTLLANDSTDTEAHYYAGIAYRESGTTKAWLLRSADWAESRNQFFWVMRHDSAFEDVLYQYARLLEYRKEFPQAIAQGHLQLKERPDLATPRLGLFRLYRSFVSDDRAHAMEWLKTEGTPIARYFLAEALRRENRPGDAEKILDELLITRALPITQSIELSLARIAATREDSAAVENHFWRAVDGIYTPLGADLVLEDLKYIATDSELDLYRSLGAPQQRIAFFHGFWNVRNPRAAGHTNIRIVEHYRRLVYAEANYEYTGFRTMFTNPDKFHRLSFPRSYFLNQEFNDMGLIYIRHGKPDNVQRSYRTDAMNESWLYDETAESPQRMFHFEKTNATANNWRLTPYPEDPNFLRMLESWDIRFADLLGGNNSAIAKATDEIAEQSRTAVEEALTTDEHRFRKEVTMFQIPHSIDAFRTKSPKSLLDISYAIPLSSLAAGSSFPGQPIRTEVGLAVSTRNGLIIASRLDTLMIEPGHVSKEAYTGLYRFLIPPEAYRFAMHVRPLEGNSFGQWRAEKAIPKGDAADLALSDIQYLLPSESRGTLEIDGVKVMPSPYSAYPTDKPVYTYFHIYNLINAADGKTSYTVRYLLIPAGERDTNSEFDPHEPGEGTIVLKEVMQGGNEDQAPQFAALNTDKVRPGMYRLIVVVNDRMSVKTIAGRRDLELYEP